MKFFVKILFDLLKNRIHMSSACTLVFCRDGRIGAVVMQSYVEPAKVQELRGLVSSIYEATFGILQRIWAFSENADQNSRTMRIAIQGTREDFLEEVLISYTEGGVCRVVPEGQNYQEAIPGIVYVLRQYFSFLERAPQKTPRVLSAARAALKGQIQRRKLEIVVDTDPTTNKKRREFPSPILPLVWR